MAEGRSVRFGPFLLDLANECVWRKDERRTLTPKAFAVLHYLVQQAGQLVTKADLFQAVWPETVVSDDALTKRIREVRRVLEDDPKAPQFIETVHRRGFRFLGRVSSEPSAIGLAAPSLPPLPIVGREGELAQLHEWFEQALHGQRQIVFLTGEAGIGKTTVVETFAAQLRGADSV